ncbi:MAG: YqeG family HAD IIIA-type phosphatase [Candidatus Obscuribacterales bacterium]|nr:YqeG family HAD IIIA-type phosphatase [Cyanobacteria bacterium SZAS LIN-5]RTL46158.1 MAG: YqeG family HAD IIIA-type phosphatase [Candidatus Melainabacteria bacterium]
MVFLRPTYLIDGDVTDIDLDQLTRDGIKGIIFDLDSTIMAPHSGKITAETATWLELARENFKLAVVSNNKNDPYIQKVQEHLNMTVLGRAAKPSRKLFLRVLDEFELPADQVVVVGDRPLTDVWGGHRAGMKTILVWPLKTMNEPSYVLFFRKLERCFIKP